MKTKCVDQRPTCAECGGHNVETTAWIEYREDGTCMIVNSEGPFGNEEGNWCHDCDAHVDLVYPKTTEADDIRRQRAAAERAHGPQIAAMLRQILKARYADPATSRRAMDEAAAYLAKLR